MNKRLIPILIISAIFLAACGNSSDTTQITDSVIDSGNEIAPAEGNTTVQDGSFTNEDEPCKPFSIMSEILSTPYSGLPPVTDDDWFVGPDDAVATFIEYSEFQCPYCAQLEPLLDAVQKRYPNDVRLVFRHRPFPESFHDKSYLAAQASEAAGVQGKFNEFKNFMFDEQTTWSSVPKDDFETWLRDHIGELDLDPTQFFDDMYSDEIVDKVQAAATTADGLDINGTPMLFINGYQWPENERTVDIFSSYVQLLKTREMEFDSCAPTVIQSGKEYSATISTTKGDIEVDLFADIAPYAVNSFVFLAQEGWYDGLPFIITNELVLSGDPSSTGYGGPGYAYLDENNNGLIFDEPGKLATFSLGPGYNGSAFVINTSESSKQIGRTIFGEVTKGMEVVNALEMGESVFEDPIDTILSVTITAK